MRLILFLLCIAEILLYTYCQNIGGIIFSPILILIISFSFAFLFLKLANSKQENNAQPRRMPLWLKIICTCGFIGLSAWIIITLIPGFHQVPMSDSTNSDVILTHVHQVRNFISGRPVYEPFSNITYMITPTYLPFQWMPYIIPEYLHFDYRWLAVGALLTASFYFFLKNLWAPDTRHLFWKIVIPLWPLVVYLLQVTSNTPQFWLSLESLAASYYLLLVTALDKNKWLLIAISIAICVLSRMSIALWVPLCVAAYFIYGQRKNAFVIAGICFLFVLVFYVPFKIGKGSFNPYSSYSIAIEDNWNRNALMNGMSFNSWGMTFLPGNAQHKVRIYNKIHLLVSAFTVLLLGLYIFRARKKYTLNSYLLFSLKVYLTVFYTFIQLPFIYLFIIPTIITSALLSHVLVTRKVAEIP